MPRKLFMKPTMPATKFTKTFSRVPGDGKTICVTVETRLENALTPRDRDITLAQIQKQATDLGYELRRDMAKLIHDRSVDPKTLAYWDPRIWIGPARKIYVCVFAELKHPDEALDTLKQKGYADKRNAA